MKYYYEKPRIYITSYADTYYCDHPVYSQCTLFRKDDKGLAIIQQRYDSETKHTWWGCIDPWLIETLYFSVGFSEYFDKHSSTAVNKLYSTVTVRQIMWGLKLKPIKRQPWETVFDKCDF